MATGATAARKGTPMFDPVVIGPDGRPQSQERPRPLLRTMLGDVLRRTRLEQGRTLADVARAARVSMPYLSEVERGRKEASSEVLAAICDALQLELADLLAVTGRDLTETGNRQARIVRLDSVRGLASPPPRPGSGEASCLLAA
jgi:transcriptional regulator with XRE-family HTH domain